jgi:hypothetical protein
MYMNAHGFGFPLVECPGEALKYIYVIHLRCSIMPVKTTIILKDEIYQHLITKYGRRKISKTINDILTSRFSKSKKSIFGVDPWLTVKGLRDEREPHENA